MTRIGIGQAAFHVAEPEYDLTVIQALLDEADKKGVEVLVLPELSNTGYSLASHEEAQAVCEEIPTGPASQALMKWSASGRMVAAGLGEQRAGCYYSAGAVFADGQHLATYRKLHLFAREPEVFTPGWEEPPLIDYRGHRYGVLVCYDWAFPEIFRVLALQGAQMILHPANLVLPYCQAAMVTRSVENRIFTATSNRTGPDRELFFNGRSQMTAPNGEIIAQASADFQGVLVADMDLAEADNKMITPYNHVLNDRRTDLYRKIL